MRLETVLKSTPDSELVPVINHMLDRAQVSLSWWGKRLVRVEGYEGTVTIDNFVKEFLRATPLKRQDSPSLQDRMHCYTLWDRVQGLYDQSDEQLKKTCLYRILVPLFECPSHFCPCTEDSPMSIMGEWDESREEVLFKFTPREYFTYFPDSNQNYMPDYVTKDRIQAALHAKQS